MTWGGAAWMVPMMEAAQTDLEAYSNSERLRVAASLQTIDRRGDLLYEATAVCPFNLAAWQARAEFLYDAFEAEHDCTQDSWFAEALEELENDWENQTQVVSCHQPVRTSDPEFESRGPNLVSCTGSEWWTKQETAWIEIDLDEPCYVEKASV